MILFDYKIFFLQKYGGISRYFIELFKKFDQNNIDYLLQVSIHQNYYLKINSIKKSKNIHLNNYPKYTRKMIESINNYFFLKKIKSEKFKIIHNTYYGNNILNQDKTIITSVYDFTHEIFSDEFNYSKNIKKNSIKNSNHFICISENTKNDLIKFYNINEKNISVIYLGGDHLPKSNFTFESKPFVLYVGYRENYKNFEILLKSFYESDKLKNDFDIICYGSNKFTKNELSKIQKYGLLDKVKHMAGDDQLLSNLYSSAKCHVITSRYEGFGITAIEAYNFGCPVILNNSSSLKEVGTKTNSFEGSSEQLKILLEKTLYSEEFSDEIKNIGEKFKKKFSWNNCYKETIKVYEKFLPTKL